ncbi:molybdopterin molybdochelatase [Propionispira arboris]|uniref:Molybdopterin molybdenumtransferase n=1 Tax=Propionispira arboris TaxID=84035 RepID=A0A1H6XMU2_9FIRM|nr:gephyrin-like molybdotransferase Glp [Propionispira arboris]SEJ30408.1 molybdopterin molybdochelatase [Propionispira arboris]
MDFFQCISLKEAQRLIENELLNHKIEQEILALPASLGRIAACDIQSTVVLPSFSRSTVDGFAVRSSDTFAASETSPAMFTIVGEVCMGKSTALKLLPGEAVHIPTGGMLPQNADAVVMIEYTEQMDETMLMVLHAATPKENVVWRGEDVQAKQLLVEKGQQIASRHIGILAACGIGQVAVNKKLRVAVFSTGDELVDLGQKPEAGQLWDTNSYVLAAMLEEQGFCAVRMGIVEDTQTAFLAALQKGIEGFQAVLISGGSSVGVRDHTVNAVNALGKPGVLFHGLMIKPGKPMIFGSVNAVPIFGLPGHPVAACTVCKALVLPALARMSGENVSHEITIKAKLMRNIASSVSRDDFIQVKLVYQEGEYQAIPILGKSGLIRLLAEADGMIQIPAGKTGCSEGEIVEVFHIHQIKRV